MTTVIETSLSCFSETTTAGRAGLTFHPAHRYPPISHLIIPEMR